MDIFNIYLPIAGIEFNILVLLAIGFSVGVLGGFFGMGGAWIVTPGLNIFGFSMPFAIGTDLAHIMGKSIIATIKHGKMGNVDVPLGILLIFGTVLGVEVGAQNVMWLERLGIAGPVIRIIYMILLFGLGFYMIYDYYTATRKLPKKSHEAAFGTTGKAPLAVRLQNLNIPPMINLSMSNVSISFWVVTGIAFVTGWLSGLLGVGGGFIRMPALIYLIGCPTAVAVGTDLFSVIFSGAYGCFTYGIKGRVEIVAAAIMLLGATIGAQLGVSAVKYIRGYGIRLLFAIMIVIAGVTVLLKQVKMALPAQILILGAALTVCVIIMFRLFKGISEEKSEKKGVVT